MAQCCTTCTACFPLEQRCTACFPHGKKDLGIVVDHQVQVLALCEQQQLQQHVQRGQSAAVLIRLTLGTCRVGESPDLHSDRPSPWASWPARDEG